MGSFDVLANEKELSGAISENSTRLHTSRPTMNDQQ